MATDFIMPQIPGQQQPQQYRSQHPLFQPTPIQTGYQPSAQYTPQVSPLSTSGNSASALSRKYITRQIRPLYIPAVLRPTEFPSKVPPPRPSPGEDDETSEESFRQHNSFKSLGGLSPLSAFGRLSRRSTGDSDKSVDGSWNLDLFPKPTGPPTRKHWKVCHGSLCNIACARAIWCY